MQALSADGGAIRCAVDAPERKVAHDLLRRIPSASSRQIAAVGGRPEVIGDLLAGYFADAEIDWLAKSSDAPTVFRAGSDVNGLRTSRLCPSRAPQSFDLVISFDSLEISRNFRDAAPGLLELIRPGGYLAAQFHNDLHEPNRQLLRMVAVDGPWANSLLPVAKSRPFNETIDGLDALLGSFCSSIQFWEIATYHRLDDVKDIIELMKANNLAPYLAALDSDMRQGFLARYADELAKVYTRRSHGTILFKTPWIQVVARRQAF